MKMKFLFLFALLITLTGSYKEQAKAASNFVITTESLAARETIVAPRFTQAPVDFTVTEGQSVKVKAYFDGNPSPEVTVYDNKGRVVTMLSTKIQLYTTYNSVTISIRDVKMEDAGMYSIEITNKAGSVETQFRLIVRAA